MYTALKHSRRYFSQSSEVGRAHRTEKGSLGSIFSRVMAVLCKNRKQRILIAYQP